MGAPTQQHHRKAPRSDASPRVDAGALGDVRRGRCHQVLAPDLPIPQAANGHPQQHRTLATDAGADLGAGSADSVTNHLNGEDLQLSFFSLTFGTRQIRRILLAPSDELSLGRRETKRMVKGRSAPQCEE